MKNDKLIDYKETIFVKIFKFFNLILPPKRNIVDIENMKEKSITKEKDSISFFENIKIKENEEEIRLKRLQLQYDNGEIDEDDISEEDMNSIIEMYEKETEELNADTEMRKNHIVKILNSLH